MNRQLGKSDYDSIRNHYDSFQKSQKRFYFSQLKSRISQIVFMRFLIMMLEEMCFLCVSHFLQAITFSNFKF